jgi:hypothetical protein
MSTSSVCADAKVIALLLFVHVPFPIEVGSGLLAILIISPGFILAAVGPAVIVFQASAKFCPPNGVTVPVLSDV